MVMHDAEQLVAMLQRLKRLGVQIAVDDFGTGYSSLELPASASRSIGSRSTARSCETSARDADDAAIVRAIIALGHNLGLKVVAEGVETEEQIDFLRRQRLRRDAGLLLLEAGLRAGGCASCCRRRAIGSPRSPRGRHRRRMG